MSLTVHNNRGHSSIRNPERLAGATDFSEFNYKMPPRQSMTDVDGIYEYNGAMFVLEDKDTLNSVNGGQRLSLFTIAFHSWKQTGLGCFMYRIGVKGSDLYTFICYGSEQFKQYEAGQAVEPAYIEADNEWLACTLRDFYNRASKLEYKYNKGLLLK